MDGWSNYSQALRRLFLLLTEGQVPRLIEYQHVYAKQPLSDSARLAVLFFALQQIDQIHCGVEVHMFVMRRDPGLGRGGGKVYLDYSRLADEHRPPTGRHLFAPVELESIAECERQQYKGPLGFALLTTRRTYERGGLAEPQS